MTKIYVCSRFTHFDNFMFNHFVKYYLKLGVFKFLINFNYKLENDKADFEIFLESIKSSPYIQHIVYNIGPNSESKNESGNIEMLYKLVNENVNLEDYIIPADSDEFQEFSDSLENIIELIKTDNYSFLCGCTKERVSESGKVTMVVEDKERYI